MTTDHPLIENSVVVTHRQIALQSSYDSFTTKLESTIKFVDVEYAKDVLTDPGKVQSYLKSLEGNTGLILFNIQNHGALLNISGKPRKAKQYVIGNPLIAIQMTIHDIRASLYAPLRIIIYEAENKKAFVEYDLPSSLFAQFGNSEILKVATGLDEKLFHVVSMCDKS
jgi:uncharacterized protein (DUF302 family)